MSRSLVLAMAVLCSRWWVPASGEEAGCSTCRHLHREELRTMNLENIKEQILTKLGMKHAPNITGRQLPQIPALGGLERLWAKNSMQGDQPSEPSMSYPEEKDDGLTTEKVIAFAQPHPKLRHGRGQDILYFKFSDKVKESQVVRAKLWLYLKQGRVEDEGSPIFITLYRILRIPNNSENPILSRFTSTKEHRPRGSDGTWVSLEVGTIVEEWFKFPRENLGLMVAASGPGHQPHSHLLVTSHSHQNTSQIPFLEIFTAEELKRRTKRTLGLNCPENSPETRCCRYPLTVDFEEFGWDWVIAPKSYEAYYCAGDCPFVFLQSQPHTHIVHISQVTKAGPCCAPRKFSPISMLYFDQNLNIIYGILKGMVVDRCGCS